MLVAYAKLALKARPAAQRAAGRAVVPVDAGRLLPGADPRPYARPAGQPPAAPRDHHQLGGQLDGQPGRHHVRLPRRRRRPARRPSRSPARSWSAARSSTCSSYVAAVEALDNVVPTDAQTALYLEFRRLLDRSVRWFLQNRPASLDVGAEVERFSGGRGRARPAACRTCCRVRSASGSSAGSPGWRRPARRPRSRPAAAGLLDQFSLLDVVEICGETGRDAGEVAPVYFATSEQFGIDGMLTRVTRLPRDDRWDALARGALRDDLYAVLESLTTSVLDGQRARPDRDRADRAVGEDQRRVAHPGPHRARGHRADREPGHRRAVGGAAHPARRSSAAGRHDDRDRRPGRQRPPRPH